MLMPPRIRMKKVTFDTKGNPYPYKIINLTLNECKQYFITDFQNEQKRVHNWKNFLLYRQDLKKHVKSSLTQWIDGSYTTTKLKPNDIDVVSFIDSSDFVPQIASFDMNLSNKYPKNKYNIDGYIVINFPIGSKEYIAMTVSRYQYWVKWFGHDRHKNQKGIIEIKDE